MKRVFRMILACSVFLLLGCTEHVNPPVPTPGQTSELGVEVQRAAPESRLAVENQAEAGRLFQENNIDIDNLVFTEFDTDELGMTHITVDRLKDGKRVFFQEQVFHFAPDGSLSSVTGDPVELKAIFQTPTVREDRAAAAALEQVRKMEPAPFGGNLPGEWRIELGYLPAEFPENTSVADLHLVWQIRPVGEKFPMVFVNARDGGIEYSDSGVRT